MATYYMISGRSVNKTGFGMDRGDISYWLANTTNPDDIQKFATWQKVSFTQFKNTLVGETNAFPLITNLNDHVDQKHVSLFIHGYNNTWTGAVTLYETICQSLYPENDQTKGLGICVLYDWPSAGEVLGYEPDRAMVRACAPDLSTVLSQLYDFLSNNQAITAADPTKVCKAKTSVIAHSMGNYLYEMAMEQTWTAHNQPQLLTLINQALMVAADVDNDIFNANDPKSDGEAMANLSYRITALYTGKDNVLGASAALKHFGKRRLGRSGLDPTITAPDNVWALDCSQFVPPDEKDVHSFYFRQKDVVEIMRSVLQGVDRTVISSEFVSTVGTGP